MRPPLIGHGLGDRVGGVHGDDLAIDEHEIGRRLGARRGAAGPAGGHGGGDDGHGAENGHLA